ncbi:MAG TPA: DUF5615 family PIN-like protein [Gemmatales bacterium]|nr:DUF5615 family PIN-like protein [Gemmatales bacterium]
MRLFADENLPAGILNWLRTSGHDVISASEMQCGEADERWLQLANADQRLIVTADKDFGELIYREGLSSYGVILLRMDDAPVRDWIVRLQEAWSIVEANPNNKFIVISTKRVRVRKLP